MALIQAVADDNAGVSGNHVVTLPSTSTVGNAMLVFVGLRGTIAGVVDSSGSNTYAQDATFNDGLGNTLYAYRCKNMGATATTVTIQTMSNPGCIFIMEESGLNKTAAIDVTASQNQASVSSWFTPNPSATTNANDTLYSFTFNPTSSNRSFAPGSGWATFAGTGITSGHHGNATDGDDMFCERQTVTATGVYPGTGTCNAGSKVLSMVVAYVQASALVNVVQETASTGNSGATMALAYTSGITAGSSGHCIVEALTATSFTSCTDNKGNTWTQRGSTLNDGGSGHIFAHFTCDNMQAGATTVTVGMSPNGASASIWIREIGNTAGYDTHAEQVQLAYGATTTDGVTSGLASPVAQPGLVSGVSWLAINTPPVLSAGTGYTSDTVGWTGGLSQHVRYTTLTPIASTYTNSTTNSTNVFSVAALFKETGATNVAAWVYYRPAIQFVDESVIQH